MQAGLFAEKRKMEYGFNKITFLKTVNQQKRQILIYDNEGNYYLPRWMGDTIKKRHSKPTNKRNSFNIPLFRMRIIDNYK